MATNSFLREFPPVSNALWEEEIRKDLKGADSNKLTWQAEEGLKLKPYYGAEDIADLGFVHAPPRDFPYVRGTRSTAGWRIREDIEVVDPEEANQAALRSIAVGAEEIAFRNVRVGNASDLGMLLTHLELIPIHFENADQHLLHMLIDRLNNKSHSATISTGFDPFSNPDFAVEMVRNAPRVLAPFTIYADEFEEWGTTAIQETGLALAAGIDLLAMMQARGATADRAADSVAFCFAIGGNFFVEIAKLRAFRMLWARALEPFGASLDHARARIHARTSRWNQTIYDPHVNILRSTTEAMSAVLGGADSITVAPFDDSFKAPDEASRRLARNTQLILKHEAQLGRVADSGSGSYFLEAITDLISREAWKLMQKIEAGGGYRKASTDGLVVRMLEKSRVAAEQAIETRRRVLTGTNRYADPTERALSRTDTSHTPPPRRGAQSYEEMRLRTERYSARTGKTPRILLAEIGDAKMRSARSYFTADLFACAGLAATKQMFRNTDEIAAADSDLIVLCSSDPEYQVLATDLLPKLSANKRQTPVVIAGNPDTVEQLKAIGIADFVHVRTNPIEFLTRWQQRLGIEA